MLDCCQIDVVSAYIAVSSVIFITGFLITFLLEDRE